MIVKIPPLLEMEPFYRDAERQFLEFNEIIPIDKNPKTEIYSPRFFSMIYPLGAQVDAMLQILLKDLGITPKIKNFPEYYDALNTGKALSFQKVQCLLDRSTIQPFEKSRPEWWAMYNKAKHELPFGIESIRLSHILDLLAGLYVLNDLAWTRELITDPGIDLSDYCRQSDAFLDIKNWRDEEHKQAPDSSINNSYEAIFKSKIFSRRTYYYPKEN